PPPVPLRGGRRRRGGCARDQGHPAPRQRQRVAGGAPVQGRFLMRSTLRERRERVDAPASTPAWERLDEHLVSLLAPGSFEAEQHRVLRHIVEQFYKDADVRVIGLTCAMVADGKTTTALNLA